MNPQAPLIITILAAVGTAVLGGAAIYGLSWLIYDTHSRRIRQLEEQRQVQRRYISHPVERVTRVAKPVEIIHEAEWREKHANAVRWYEEKVGR